MKTLIISYSLTGNNDILAKTVASAIKADHIRISEKKKRTMGTIMFDLISGRKPVINTFGFNPDAYDLIVFAAPVWIGKVATPLRSCIFEQRKSSVKCAFFSISGGADGPNLKLAAELAKRSGKEPVAVIDMHIADLLPKTPKPTRNDTSAYRLTAGDVSRLSEKVVSALKKIM